jgi:hypothetical protein
MPGDVMWACPACVWNVGRCVGGGGGWGDLRDSRGMCDAAQHAGVGAELL